MSSISNEELAGLGDRKLLDKYNEGPYLAETQWPRKIYVRARKLASQVNTGMAQAHRYPLAADRRAEGDGHLRIFCVQNIEIPTGRRAVDDDCVSRLVSSIEEIGLISPLVTIRDNVEIDGEFVDGVPILITGRHRIEAMRRLGFHSVACLVVSVDDVNAELMEIFENLDRAELTALQRDEQIARWIELTKTKQATEDTEDAVISAQVAPKSPGRPESGINAAARELGIERTTAQRDVKVAGLCKEAKHAAVNARLGNNRTALLAAAKEREPEKQVKVIKARAVTPTAKQTSEPELAARLKARDERDKAELAAFMARVYAIAPLLAEIECGDEVCVYDDLTYLQVAGRYKPIMALRAYPWRLDYGKAAGEASRRIEAARDGILNIFTGKAEDELEKAAADSESVPAAVTITDTFDGAPIPRTPMVDLDAA